MENVEARVLGDLEADKAAVRAVSGPLNRVRLDGETALGHAQGLQEQAITLLALAVGVFHEEHRALLERLRASLVKYALVFYGADLSWRSATPNTASRAERERLVKLARQWDRRLMTQARAQFDEDADITLILDDIHTGTGTRDDAEDVLRLLALLFERWDTVGARLAWTRAELETVETDMTTLLKLLRPQPVAEQAGVLLRQQAYTRFARAYNEVLAACRYLARDNREALAELRGLTVE